MATDPHDSGLDAWLEELGLGEYVETFRRNHIDDQVLPHLTGEDLKELGLSVGQRRRLLLAVESVREPGPPPPPAAAPGPPAGGPGEAEHRQLTVVFCDLVDSTVLAQSLDAENFREVLLRYQDAATAAVTRYGGHVAQYLGDGVLVYFGYPQAHEDDAERAVRAALSAVRAIKSLSFGEGPAGAVRLAVRIGIATGPVVVGDNRGKGGSKQLTAMGGTPHLAARLQSLAGPNQVVIAPATRGLLARLFTYRRLGPRRLKGIPQLVDAWQVLEETRPDSRFDAVHAGRLTPFVGRAEEIDLLSAHWASARDGQGRVVFVSGEAGIGKSRTVEAFRDVLAHEPHNVIRMQCSSYHTFSTLHPVVDFLQRAGGLARSDDDEHMLDKLEGLLRRCELDLEGAVPLLAALLSIPGGARYPAPDLTPDLQKAHTLAALADLVARMAGQRPLLLILEDAHWADPTTVEWLAMLVERARALPALLLVTHRPHMEVPWTGKPHVSAIVLGKLSNRQTRALLDGVTAGRALPDAIYRHILDHTDGVPLFVEELTKSILASDQLRAEGDRFILDIRSALLSIPSTLQDSLMARLDQIPAGKRIAQIGAVVGREFRVDLLAALLGVDESELDEPLDTLAEAGLVFRRDSRSSASYVFKHALIQETAYASLLTTRRRTLHADIAETLERDFPEVARAGPEILAHHFRQAERAERAAEHFHAAGVRANRRSANEEAYNHLSAALACLDSLPDTESNRLRTLEVLVESISPVSAFKGYTAPELERIYEQALAICRGTGGGTERMFPVLYTRWLVTYVRGDLREARTYAREFLDLALEHGAALPAAVARRCLGIVLTVMGRPLEALEHFESASRAVDDDASTTLGYAFGGQDTLVALRCSRAFALSVAGYPDAARASIVAALDRARGLEHAQTLIYGHVQAGYVSAALRDAAALADHAAASAAVVKGSPMALWSHAPRLLSGLRALHSGDHVDACVGLSASIDEFSARAMRVFMPNYLCHLAQGYLATGDLDTALATVEEGLDDVGPDGESWYASELHRVRAGILDAMGESRETVEREHRTAVSIARAQSAKLFELRAACDLARFLAGQERGAEARALLAPVHAWFTEGAACVDLREAVALLADLGDGRPARRVTR